MRREGWQHGMVIAHTILPPPWCPRPDTKFINRFDSPPTAGLRTRVPLKPTNHSKFTGKCRRVGCQGCHSHPVSKSRDKAKGAHKLKSCDVSLNHRLASWRVVDNSGCRGFSGISATGVLEQLSGQGWDEGCGEYEDSDCQRGDHDVLEESEEMREGNEGSSCNNSSEMREGNEGSSCNNPDDETDFCQVGFVVEYLDGEDWCVVREM